MPHTVKGITELGAAGAAWPVPGDEPDITAVLRLYCEVAAVLDEQFARFDAAETVSYSIIKNLIRVETNKGPLWWLKDSSSIILNKTSAPPASRLLGWGIGYLFHEIFKLIETAHQHRRYLPELRDLNKNFVPTEKKELDDFAAQICLELSEDLTLGVERARTLLHTVRSFFIPAFAGFSGNLSLARFLYQQNELAQSVFKEEYDKLVLSIYGSSPEALWLAAARSFLEGAYFKQAEEAAKKALEAAPGSTEAGILLQEAKRFANSPASSIKISQ